MPTRRDVEVAKEPPGAPVSRPPYIVGVGASAGGLAPLECFFDNIPADSGAAFVVVQHLSPDFKSLMKELLTRHTAMPLHRVTDGMACEGNSIYLIPPKKNMSLVDGVLRLTDQDLSEGHAPHFAIDSFFESLARDIGETSVAVVLSGTGTDGSRGVRAVNEAGGLVLVQSPETAQFDGMPRSAISTGSAHAVLSPEEIASSIYAYVTQDRGSEAAYFPGVSSSSVISEVTNILLSKQDVDFSHYRASTVGRRLARRISITNSHSDEDYIQLLSNSPTEQEALRDDLLIGVTRFFRDQGAWDEVEKSVIRPLIRERDPSEPLRIWCTACSTGEEVYSLGMLVLEVLNDFGKSLDVKIFATDIDRASLQRAALGSYPINVVTDIGANRISRFFTQGHDGFRVNRALREVIIFAEHDLTRDAPFTRMDLVTCRNVLIYMEPELQENVIRMLHFSLRVGGTLLLGPAETLGNLDPEFGVVNGKWKLFEKKRDVSLTREGRRQTMGIASPVSVPTAKQEVARPAGDALERAFREHIRRTGSTCFIVDPQGTLMHTLGPSGPYLSIPEGRGTSDITKLVEAALSLPLNTALHQATRSREATSFGRIATPHGDVDLEVLPFLAEHAEVEFLTVLLRPNAVEEKDDRSTFEVDEVARKRIVDLESELQTVKQNLQSTIVELETTNHEHHSTNEELLAANEELQSTNEELQSVNEELFTVNAEHQQKIGELTELNTDMDNLLLSTRIGTLFLDGDLRIRKVPSTLKIINASDRDVGRRVDHFSHRTDCDDLFEIIAAVNADAKPRERVLTNEEGMTYFVRFLPYRREDKTQDGVVITFMQSDELKSAMRRVEAHLGKGEGDRVETESEGG